MNSEDLAQSAYTFRHEFKEQVRRQIAELNAIGDGELQDGFNEMFVEDGWVSLKGYSWGFVVHNGNPVTIDMTFGPDAPFVGYKITFAAKPINGRLAWVNEQQPNETCFDAEQLARFGLRKLACKTGDDWIFKAKYSQQSTDAEFMGENI